MENSVWFRRSCLWLSLAAACAYGSAVHAERLHRFTISINPELTRIDVRACFDGRPPNRLVAESLDAAIALIGVKNESTGKEIVPSGYIPLRSVANGGCISYQSDVSRPIKLHDRTGGKIRRIGSDLAASTGLWFWRPDRLGADEDVELEFNLPEGIAVSAPWFRLDDAANPTYRLGRTPYDWPAWVAFGRFTERDIDVAGSRLRLSVLDGSPPVDVDQIADWIADAANMVGNMYGRFPFPQTQVMVVPNSKKREPTPWAFVVRGGNPAVHFVINQRRPIQEFYDDWTATHEFAHLFLPFVQSSDAWLSEGVATYYQNVLRARRGRLSEQEAWSHLHAGFGRGKKDTRGLTLAAATQGMYRGGHYMRVYWSGTAIVMLADLQLRKISSGRQSLDTALDALNQCCSQVEREWSARELFGKLDEITGTTVFTHLLDQHVDSNRFPDLSAAYRDLGIVPYGRDIDLTPDAPLAAVREAIMSGKSGGMQRASSH